MSITSELKALRQQVERLQVEVAGRQALGAVVITDDQNQSSVDSEVTRIREDFSGLVVHLTPEPSPSEGTVGLSQNEFAILKQEIVDALESSSARTVSGAA